MYVPKDRASKELNNKRNQNSKKNWTKFTIIAGDFDTPLSASNRTTKN